MSARAEAARETRKELLRLLTFHAAGGWRLAPMLAELAGPTRLETRRKSYRFEDGVCVEVVRRDGLEGEPDPLLGMRIAGWLDAEGSDPGAGVPVLLTSWRPGTSAVLWRPEGRETVTALTSPSFAFFHAGNTPKAEPDVREQPTSRFHAKDLVRANPPAPTPLPRQSMTRMFF